MKNLAKVGFAGTALTVAAGAFAQSSATLTSTISGLSMSDVTTALYAGAALVVGVILVQFGARRVFSMFSR